MSHGDLIAALRAQAAEKSDEMRLRAEEEAAALTAESETRLLSLEEEEKRLRLGEEKRLTSTIVAQADQVARRLLADARSRLAERLATLARQCLLALRDSDYETAFAELSNEMPAEKWSQIVVCPADAALARKYFPATPVVEDESIIGGFKLRSGDGLLTVDNTLGKRLERSWPALLPKIVDQVEKEAAN